MSDKSSIYKSTLLFVIIAGIALFFYTSYRAATLSITHDEGVIYQVIYQHSLGKILTYVIPQDHMINSFLMKLSCQLFPDSEYTVRLPNLLGHLLYIIFSILLLLKLKNPHLLATGFVLLNFNPYLLDFFSIARGYGLSVSFMMVSIYFGYSFIQSRKILALSMAFLFAILSVLTVYTLMNYFFALCGVAGMMMLIWWADERFKLNRRFLSNTGIYILVIAASTALLYFMLHEPLKRVQSEQFIYQAERANFYSYTIRSIIFRSIFNSDPKTTVDIASYGFIALYFLALIMMVVMSIRRNFTFTGRLMLYSFTILFIVALSTTLQYKLFNIRFVNCRSATFVAPLIVLVFIGLAEELIRRKMMKIPVLIIIYAVSALFIYNTVKHANFKWYLDWQYDASTSEMMNDLRQDVGTKPAKEVKLGIAWQYEPSINFYKIAWHLDWLKRVDRNGYNGDFDYYYVDNVDSVMRKDIFRDKTIIKSYGESNTVLLKKALPDEANSQ
jgi:uncharacterized membrane protein